MDFHGYAIGGLAVGEPQAVMLSMIDIVRRILPADRPRYLMGVGTPDDLIEAVCARHRHVRLRDADPQRPPRRRLHPLRPGQSAECAPSPTIRARWTSESGDPATRTYSRAYLHHLVKANETLGAMLLSAINLAYYQTLMRGAREAIAAGTFADFAPRKSEAGSAGDIPPR